MSPDEAFAHAFQLTVMELEGGAKVTDDPADDGGLTKWGIALKEHPELTREQLLHMTLADARAFYRRKYWDPMHGDELPSGLALLAFDMAVNPGPHDCVRWLQQAGAIAPVDGIFGPHTLAALRGQDPVRVIIVASTLRRAHYMQQPSDEYRRFGKGWLRRTDRVREEALALA